MSGMDNKHIDTLSLMMIVLGIVGIALITYAILALGYTFTIGFFLAALFFGFVIGRGVKDFWM